MEGRTSRQQTQIFLIGELSQTGDQTGGERRNVFEEERVDLRADHDEKAENVEEDQRNDDKTKLSDVIRHELMHVDREELKQDEQTDCDEYRAAPAEKKTDFR